MAYGDFLFSFGLLFAMLDAYNIGANDVANSWATSVSSRSVSLKMSIVGAAIFEFVGAVTAGQRVSGTIKNGIIKASAFQDNAGVQLMAFTVAITVSASWLMLATNRSWPVSTTYSIISALIGVGYASGGTEAVVWGWNGSKGLAAIWAGMLIAPSMAAGFAMVVYLITKFGVLMRKDPVKAGLILSPFFFFTVTAVLTLSIVYKGAPQLKLNELSNTTVALAIVLTALVVAVLSQIFWLPYVYAHIVKHDYSVRWYHFFLGPLLWRRQPPEDAGQVTAPSAVPDYTAFKPNTPTTDAPEALEPTDVESRPANADAEKLAPAKSIEDDPATARLAVLENEPKVEGAPYLPRNLWIILRYKVPKIFTHGANMDIHKLQEVEHLFSFLQVMTACTASFAHGSNDLANASGPFSVIYHVWHSSSISGSKTKTPIWIFIFMALMLVLGLATYGYRIMAVLGNRLTKMSPSRGYSMELGSSITIIIASVYSIPVSTTMCITGATLGVALCNGDIRSFNWKGLGWIVLGWILTIPVVSVASGCIMGILLNAPSFNSTASIF